MMEPQPLEMRHLFAVLRTNQADMDRFMSTLSGTFPVAEFFAPRNRARIVGAAALHV